MAETPTCRLWSGPMWQKGTQPSKQNQVQCIGEMLKVADSIARRRESAPALHPAIHSEQPPARRIAGDRSLLWFAGREIPFCRAHLRSYSTPNRLACVWMESRFRYEPRPRQKVALTGVGFLQGGRTRPPRHNSARKNELACNLFRTKENRLRETP